MTYYSHMMSGKTKHLSHRVLVSQIIYINKASYNSTK